MIDFNHVIEDIEHYFQLEHILDADLNHVVEPIDYVLDVHLMNSTLNHQIGSLSYLFNVTTGPVFAKTGIRGALFDIATQGIQSLFQPLTANQGFLSLQILDSIYLNHELQSIAYSLHVNSILKDIVVSMKQNIIYSGTGYNCIFTTESDVGINKQMVHFETVVADAQKFTAIL